MSLVAETATLAHGYTMGDVDRMARRAARSVRMTPFDFIERYEHAWYGVVEMLYSSHSTPTEYALVTAGMRCVSDVYSDTLRHHGVSRSDAHTGQRFAEYWRTPGHTTTHEDFVDRLTERMALPRVLALLTPEEYEALAARAASSSDNAAAAMLGMTFMQYRPRLKRARERIVDAWFAPETPRPVGVPRATAVQRAAGQCKRGHSAAVHGLTTQGYCRACARASARRAARKIRARQALAKEAS